MSISRTIAFTGGGTAGHVIPAIPVMAAMMGRDYEVIFIGSNSGLEEQLISGFTIRYFGITTGKLRRYLSIRNLLDALLIPLGILQALLVLLRVKPCALFSKGGYVAFPAVVAAWVLRIPVVAHESDLSPGLATRLCTPFIKTQCVTFAETQTRAQKVVYSGTPIREFLAKGDPHRAREWLNYTGERPVIVVVGGSLGAQAINDTVRECLDALLQQFAVVHVCGNGHVDPAYQSQEGYYQFEFIDHEWGDVLALADFVISRAGANSLYELLYLRKPNLLIPLSRNVSRGDQIENATYAEARCWSLVLPEEQLTAAALLSNVHRLREQQTQWAANLTATIFPDAVAVIVEEIEAVLRSKSGS